MPNELQDEELEVLKSIYDGDENFKVNSEAESIPTFQYKIFDSSTNKSFLLEISWGENYPDEKPNFNLDAFYNKHLNQDVKNCILSRINDEAEQFLGTAMTYTLIEWAKENVSDLLANHVEEVTTINSTNESVDKLQTQDSTLVENLPKVKKENLTKQQKRRLYDQVNVRGERPRGWDWVDVIKHLSQTGGSKQGSPDPAFDS